MSRIASLSLAVAVFGLLTISARAAGDRDAALNSYIARMRDFDRYSPQTPTSTRAPAPVPTASDAYINDSARRERAFSTGFGH